MGSRLKIILTIVPVAILLYIVNNFYIFKNEREKTNNYIYEIDNSILNCAVAVRSVDENIGSFRGYVGVGESSAIYSEAEKNAKVNLVSEQYTKAAKLIMERKGFEGHLSDLNKSSWYKVALGKFNCVLARETGRRGR